MHYGIEFLQLSQNMKIFLLFGTFTQRLSTMNRSQHAGSVASLSFNSYPPWWKKLLSAHRLRLQLTFSPSRGIMVWNYRLIQLVLSLSCFIGCSYNFCRVLQNYRITELFYESQCNTCVHIFTIQMNNFSIFNYSYNLVWHCPTRMGKDLNRQPLNWASEYFLSIASDLLFESFSKRL